jgi:hypothetical protein
MGVATYQTTAVVTTCGAWDRLFARVVDRDLFVAGHRAKVGRAILVAWRWWSPR